jgi:hypothetical protein
MAHAENEATINRSPEDVYAFLADGLNDSAWRSVNAEVAQLTNLKNVLGSA